MRQEAERKRDDRFTQQMEIAEHALYDKDANEVNKYQNNN